MPVAVSVLKRKLCRRIVRAGTCTLGLGTSVLQRKKQRPATRFIIWDLVVLVRMFGALVAPHGLCRYGGLPDLDTLTLASIDMVLTIDPRFLDLFDLSLL